MTKRSHQAASRYASRSGQGKRKRPPKSQVEASPAPDKPVPVQTGPGQGSGAGVQRIASQVREEVQPRQVTKPMPNTSERLRIPAVAVTYAYIASDLKRTGIIAVAIFALLIVLAIIFG